MKQKIKKALNGLFKQKKIYVRQKNSFSQSGEDGIIHFLLNEKRVAQPSYLDLGAFAPKSASNTYRFYLQGSKGVLVEADSELIPKLKEVRPNDIVLNIGVGLKDKSSAKLHIYEERALNTLSQNEVNLRLEETKLKSKKIVEVQIRTINSIIEENFQSYPDVLSIDLEGLDLPVLKSLSYDRFPIPIICAETCKYSNTHIREKDSRIEEFLNSVDYMKYGDTYINTIFVNRQWFFS